MTEKELASVWAACQKVFAATLTRPAYNLWFADLRLLYLDDVFAVVTAADDFKIDIIKNSFDYAERIVKALREQTGRSLHLVALSEQHGPIDLSAVLEKEREALADYAPAAAAAAAAVEPAGDSDRFPTLGYTFDSFIAGSSNKFAKASAMAVAEAPGRDYNPLFIYGASGLGKTHLLYAAVNRMRESDPGLRVKYVKCEDFLNQLIDSIQHNTNAAFRARFRNNDVLLIDDIQFLAGKASVQEEFFNTFNDLYEAQKQIIVTSDRPPKEIEPLEERIQSRFEWGLVADITPPDFELRVAILRDKAERKKIAIPDEIIQYVAESITGNIRQLEGALNRLIARHYLTGEPITMENARDCLEVIRGSERRRSVSSDDILDKVARKYGVSTSDLKSRSRVRKIAYARHVAVFLMRKLTDLSFNDIAAVFSRDHTTIISSYQYIEEEIKFNSVAEIEINGLISELS